MTTLNPVSATPPDVRKEIEQTLGFVPSFIRTVPPTAQKLWWSSMRDFELSDKTELNGKTKELIGLGVAAQIPCAYCVLFHTEAARLNGATERELQETIYMASLTRQGSTILNGAALDESTFKKELGDIVAYLKAHAAAAPAM